MTYKGLWRTILAIAVSITLSACETESEGIPAIGFDLSAGSGAIVTSDTTLYLSGTADSKAAIVSVEWKNDRGGEGLAQGGAEWQIFNIPLQEGDNQISVTAADEVGNTNSRTLLVTRDSGEPAISGTDPVSGTDPDTGVAKPILMYSYSADLNNPAPADGARIEPVPVHFFVVPSDNWRQSGINHMAYYCCDKPGSGNNETDKLAVSREPWSMIIDLSNYSPGEQRSMDVEANLATGAVSKATDFNFTMSGSSPGNRAPSISGSPNAVAKTGAGYEFKPKASDPDGDTLSFSVSNQPPWTRFDTLTGRLWGTPGASDVGMHGNIRITVSDGRTSKSLSAFSINVEAGNSTPPPPPAGSNVPTISSFTSSASAIDAGGSVTLRWTVSNATSLSISPAPGTVSGTSVRVSPSTTTTYTLTARNSSGASNARVTVTVRNSTTSNDWTVSERPPQLSSPRVVDVSTLGTVSLNASGILCGGKIYRVSLGNTQDAIVHMTGNQPLRYPVHVTGGRNVRIVGLHFELETQPGCGIGELPNLPVDQHPNSNIHPRVPGAIALRLQQSRVSFVEGLHIDVRGHEADCIVSRNPDSMSDNLARSQRDVIVQNTYCSGVEGLGQSDIGDGIHGDFFQNQGKDMLRRLVFENASMRTSQEGIVLHGNGTLKGAMELTLRRYDYTWDPRYVGDDTYEGFGLAFAGWVEEDGWSMSDVYIDDYRDGLDYLRINEQRYGVSNSSNVQPHNGVRSGLPPQGAFALPGRTGVNYSSPHGNVP